MRPLYTKECPTCGAPTRHDDTFDSYACDRCDKWLEGRCNDPECEFCRARPDTPAMEVERDGD